MNKHLIAGAAALACAHAALAQGASSVEIYGLIDVGIEHVTGVGASGDTLQRMTTSSNTAPSRLGFRGSEDLGGGHRAFFTLEQGIVMKDGSLSQGGRAFGRQALVGLSHPTLGAISLGRQYTMTFWSGLNADIHGGGIYGTGSVDAYLPNARADSAVAWRKNFGNGFQLGATYSFGRDSVNAGPSPAGTNCPQQSGDNKACREWSLMAKYDAPTWGTAIAYDRQHGRSVGAAPDAVFGGLNSSDKTDSRFILNGWTKVGEVKLGGGLIRRDNEGSATRPDSDLWHLGASMPVSPALTLSGQVVTLRYKNASDFNATLYSVRAVYAFSKRTNVFAQIGHIKNNRASAVALSGGSPGSNPVAGASQTGLNIGMQTSF
jgi:predicted porin